MDCKATCPKDEAHSRFVTGVTVVITRWGAPDDDDEVLINPPSQGNAWFCHVCGAEAVVVDYEEDGPDIGPDP